MIVFRSESGDLHREGLPAIELDRQRQWFWNGTLHRSGGQAVEILGDNGEPIPEFGQYWWRGVRIPPVIWVECARCDPDFILKISNVEIRRSMIERVGMDKFLKKAKLLNEVPPRNGCPEGDKLFSLQTKRKGDNTRDKDSRFVFLYLVNHSREVDGSFKRYTLRVPPSVKLVEEGLLWAAGLEAGDRVHYFFES